MSIPLHLLRKQAGGKKPKKEKGLNVMDRIEECDRAGQYELDLSHLKLKDWPQETVILPAIHICKGYGNLFTEIPSFAVFRGLEYIDVSRCNIETIESMQVSELFNLNSVTCVLIDFDWANKALKSDLTLMKFKLIHSFFAPE